MRRVEDGAKMHRMGEEAVERILTLSLAFLIFSSVIIYIFPNLGICFFPEANAIYQIETITGTNPNNRDSYFATDLDYMDVLSDNDPTGL